MNLSNNHIGETVGVYTIVEQAPYKTLDGHILFKAICNNCGVERTAKYYDLKRTKECKHIRIDGKHRDCKMNWTNKRIKSIFDSMKQRCYNKNDRDYKWYGEKGIKVCDEWMDNPVLFEKWAMHNGYDDTLTIDRINENKNYSPDNCRWITREQNAKYKSTTNIIDVNGEKHTGKEWSSVLGLGANVINTYIRKYGQDNTVEFIKRYMLNPNFGKRNNNQSIYSLYMN